MSYSIEFADSVKAQIKSLTARQRNTLFDSIEKRLTHEPLVETRKRKPLRPNPIAPGNCGYAVSVFTMKLPLMSPMWFGFWRSGRKRVIEYLSEIRRSNYENHRDFNSLKTAV